MHQQDAGHRAAGGLLGPGDPVVRVVRPWSGESSSQSVGEVVVQKVTLLLPAGCNREETWLPAAFVRSSARGKGHEEGGPA